MSSRNSGSAPTAAEKEAAVKLLRKMVENNEISTDTDAKRLWLKHPEFNKVPYRGFYQRVYRVKQELASRGPSCTVAVDRDIQPRTTEAASEQEPKKARSENHFHEDGCELVSAPLCFKPISNYSIWTDEELNSMLTMAILLPSGIGKGMFSVAVVDEGEYLELRVKWPAPMVQPQLMHRRWLTEHGGSEGMTTYHPRIKGFHESLKEKRDHLLDDLYSIARVPLPFPVQTHITKKPINYDTDLNGNPLPAACKILYVTMAAFVEEYSRQNDQEEFMNG